MIAQTVARRSLSKGAVQARRLLADTHLSSVVIESTTTLSITDQIKRARALEDFHLGTLLVHAGEVFYFVASKFTHRYYIVIKRNGTWLTSASDERAASLMIAKVASHRKMKESVRNASLENVA